MSSPTHNTLEPQIEFGKTPQLTQFQKNQKAAFFLDSNSEGDFVHFYSRQFRLIEPWTTRTGRTECKTYILSTQWLNCEWVPSPCTLCCVCSTPIQPNKANMCINCIRSKVDITEGIQRQIVLFQCRGCERYDYMCFLICRYLRPPWTVAPPESKELLALCLKKIKGAWFFLALTRRVEEREAGGCRVRLDGTAFASYQAQHHCAEGGVQCSTSAVLHCGFRG